MNSTTVGNVTITWLGHAGFMLRTEELTVYIDPYVLPAYVGFEDQADLILITHEHYDHCSPEGIRKVRRSDSTTLVPESCGLQFKGDARRIVEGDMLTGDLAIKGLDIEVIPAYNKDKPYHPQGSGVGYIVTLGGLRIYHAGDSDFIPQMKDISADVALLPIGGTYTMDEAQAAEAAAAVGPEIVIPMHYGHIEGTEADPEKFKQLVGEKNPDVKVIILQDKE